jgi:6-phosphofructokinase 1
MIVAAEGVTGQDGKHFSDQSAGIDAFGHVRLSGVGQYIRQQLESYMKADADWKGIFQEAGLFVENIYEFPEIREVQPGHLVRSGKATAYDVSFGKQIGGAAVYLLTNGIEGVTVVGLESGTIKYLPTEQAIEQRHVDIEEVSFFESMGVCFGREPKKFNPTFKQQEGKIQRYM